MGFSPSMVEADRVFIPGVDEEFRALEFLRQYVKDMEPAIQVQPSDIQYPMEKEPGFMRMYEDDGRPSRIEERKTDFIYSPQGGVAQMAPGMMDGYVDNDFIQDSGLPYVVTPELERMRRDSMRQFQQVPPSMLPANLRGV